MDWSALAALVGIMVGLGGVGATVVFSSRVKGQRDSVEFLATANQALRDLHADSEKKRIEDSARHSAEVAELRGKLEVLQSGLVERVAEQVGRRVGEEIAAAVHEAIVSGIARGGPQ